MFKPLKDRIVVKRDESLGEVEVAGLVIPASGQVQNTGIVVSVGSDVVDVKGGDKVIFGKNTGTPQPIDGIDVLIMRENEVWGILDGE